MIMARIWGRKLAREMQQKVHQCFRFPFVESVEITTDVLENFNRERAMYVIYMLSYASQPGKPVLATICRP